MREFPPPHSHRRVGVEGELRRELQRNGKKGGKNKEVSTDRFPWKCKESKWAISRI